jgi:energy-coupling factor transporter ATP-binding protein EcfA2
MGALMMAPRLSLSRSFAAAGLSVVPIRSDGSKAAAVKWEAYQKQPPTDAELSRWFGNGSRYGLAVVHGKVSGGSECVDIDAPDLLDAFCELLEETAPGLYGRLVRVKTPRDGWHLIYRCPVVEGNQKLAERAVKVDVADEAEARRQGLRKLADGRWYKIDALVETRGEGGYAIAPGSPAECHPLGKPYELLNGSFADIPEITAEEREKLLACARAFNEFVDRRKVVDGQPRKAATPGKRPGDDYNERADVRALLERHGWKPLRTMGERELWARPGVSHTSASLLGGRTLYVFSTNAAPFDNGESYSPFAVYALLEHGGDFETAARDLARLGYGEQPPRQALKSPPTEAATQAQPGGGGEQEPRASKAKLLVDLVEREGVELFHNAEGKAFATITVNGRRQTYPLKSSHLKRHLAARFYAEYQSTIHPPAMAEALLTLEGRATYEGERREVYTRVAYHDGHIYVDLCNEAWQSVEVSKTGWRVVSDCPVRFRRAAGMLALPTPEEGGEVSDLRRHLNLEGAEYDEQWALVAAWLVQALRPRGPYPALCLHGEQGSGKSTAARMLRSLVDPNTASLRSAPKDERDLMIAANNSWCVAFDNLTTLSESLSNALCRLATGGGFATRELYANDEETIFDAQRPILLNGINEVATKSDLLDRSILVHLPVIAEEERRDEETIWGEFERDRPRIFGALLAALGVALGEIENTKLKSLPRMADFARWATAAEEGLGLAKGDFIGAYGKNRRGANETVLEFSPVAAELRELLADREQWEGQARALLAELNSRLEGRKEDPRKKEGWPRTARGLAEKLKAIAPNLRAAGFDVRFGARSKKGRTLTIIKTGKQPSPPSPRTPGLENQQLAAVTVGDGSGGNRHNSHHDRHQLNDCKIRPGDGGDGGDGYPPSFTNSTGKAAAGREVVEV